MLLCAALYVPAVERLAIDKVSGIVAEKTGMRLSIGRFRLRFPLGVSADGLVLVTPRGDTLVAADRLRADVALWPLAAGRVFVRSVSVGNARSTWRDSTSNILLRTRFDSLEAGNASLGAKTKSVEVSRLALAGADVTLDMQGREEERRDDTATVPWRVDVRRLELSGSRFSMNMPSASVRREPSEARFDPAHIRIDSIRVSVRDFSWNRGDIGLHLDRLRAVERSGLRVESAEGGFATGRDGISFTGFSVTTPRSRLSVDVRAGSGATEGRGTAPVSLIVSGVMGADDAMLFAPLDPPLRRAFHLWPVTLDAVLGGTLGDISIERLKAVVPGRAEVSLHGNLRSLDVPKDIAGRVSFDGRFRDIDFVRSFIRDTSLRRRIALPRRLALRGDAAFSPSLYQISGLRAEVDSGRLEGSGRYAAGEGRYSAELRLVDFPAGYFMPVDSLGALSLSLTAQGRGLDPLRGMEAKADVAIEKLEYRGFAYHDASLAATLDGGRLEGRLTSENEALSLDLALDGRLAPDDCSAEVKGHVRRADLRRMGFSDGGLSLGTRLDLHARIGRDDSSASADNDTVLDIAGAFGRKSAPAPKMRYTLDAALDSVAMRIGESDVRIDPVSMKISAAAGSSATVRSGDLFVELSSPLSLDSLLRSAGGAGGEVRRQLAARHFNADSLQSAFPGMMLTMRAGRNNFLHEMARLEGMGFLKASADISTRAGEPFSIEARIDGFNTGKLIFDTVEMKARRRGERLDYALRVTGHKGGVESLGLIAVSGSAGGNSASVDVYQRNLSGKTGFRFGTDATLLGETLRATMTTPDPVLGYRQWSINAENFLEADLNGKFRADLDLRGPSPGEYIRLSSASLPGIEQGALRLDVANVALDPMLDLFPSAPPLGGVLSSALTFGLHKRSGDESGILAAEGILGLGDFSYDKRRVADVAASVDFHADVAGTMALEASVTLEKRAALTASGTYTSGGMDFTVSIPGVPLSMAEAFLPADLAARLSGDLDGRIRFTGEPARPAISGEMGVRGGRADIGMLGTAFGISPDRITVEGGDIRFNGFGLVAPNNRKLSVDGRMDISDLSRPGADITLSATDFRLVNSQHIGGSQLYGNAAFDMHVTARGPLSAMRVRGDVALSEKTDIVYILRNSSRVRDERQRIVEFMVFADSLYTAEEPADTDIRRAGVDVLIGVNIGEGLKATLSLDELDENRVELIGGGDLSFSMNTRGDVRLAGRYSMTGGTVYYRPPVISQKVFAVRSGSYVEWTGEALKPEFHVTATQTMGVDVKYDEGATERVSFDITADISGSLSAMNMRFDVAAPANLAIQSQLQALSAEARMQQALSLLVYEQYTGPGVASTRRAGIDPKATLNDFIAKELNQWARNNLKGVDLAMGIDTRSDETGNSHTNYSYSVSGRLFSERVKVSIGGSIADNASPENFADHLLGNVALEYRLTRRDNMFLKLYRHNRRQSILEGQVTETGGGFLMRRKMNRPGDLFRRSKEKKLRSGKK